MFRGIENFNTVEKTSQSCKEFIDMPEHLVNFDVRKKAIENLNNQKCQTIEEQLMSGNENFQEEELLEYFDYLNNLETECFKVNNWYNIEQMKAIAKYFYLKEKKRIVFNDLDIDLWGIENGKIYFTTPHISSPGDSDAQSEESCYNQSNVSQVQTKKALKILINIGTEKSIDKIVELILRKEDFIYNNENEINSLFKKYQKYAVDKCLATIEKGDLDAIQIYATIQLLSYLQDDKEITERLKIALNELDNNGHGIYKDDKENTGKGFLAFVLYSAKKQGYKIDYKKIKNLGHSIDDFGSDMNTEDKQDVLEMARENWEKQNPKMADTVIEGLEKSLRNTFGQKCYLLKYNNKVVSFIRFEPIDDETYYCGSFNVEKILRGLGLGDEMMVMAIKNEAEKKKIEATVSPRLQAGTCYVEKIGFVLDGYIADYHGTGEPLFSMKMDKEKNENYAYRKGKENAINEEQIKKQCWTQENLNQMIGAETIVLKFDMENEFEKMHAAMQKLLVAKNDEGKNVKGQNMENKYAATRYFQEDKNDKNNQARYFVFEKIK